MHEDAEKISNQLVGNMGLYYICYELSKNRDIVVSWSVLCQVCFIFMDLNSELSITI
jgi:hypothetical protein